MNPYWKRAVGKVRLWVNFHKIADNFWTVVYYRIVTMLRLQKVLKYNAIIRLRNGIVLDYGNRLDLSAVPVVVEMWHERIYIPDNRFVIGPNDVVFDLGANTGCFALYAAQQTSGKIHAFEPIPKNFALLEKNIAANGVTNINAVQAAVADYDGVVTIHMSDVDTAHSITHQAFSQQGDIEVKALSIESFCNQYSIDRINFMKIDCEGAEYDIILNMSDKMLQRIDKIVMEHHERFVKRDHNDMSRRLATQGFAVADFGEHFIWALRK